MEPESYPLPDWAVSLAHGSLSVGSQLPTKDGRRMGNAHIIKVEDNAENWSDFIFTVLTDAGNEVRFTEREIAEIFYPPKFISDLNSVLAKFRIINEQV